MCAEKLKRSLGTHSGSFHADEVSASALLIFFDLVDQDKIHRTRDESLLATCEYVCDVGGFYDPSKKLFDHHQVEYQGELSSAGMVLLYLKEQGHLTEEEYQFFNRSLILSVDAHDNGIEPNLPFFCSFSHVISNYNPIEYGATHEEQNEGFFTALDFTLGHLRRLYDRYHYIQSCRDVIVQEMEKQQQILFFEKGIPWLDIFFENRGQFHPALFIIMPSGGQWKLRAVPPSMDERMKVRVPLPEEWAGLHDEDLVKVCGISGAVFCHKGRFISVWETKEAAIEAAEKVLANQGSVR